MSCSARWRRKTTLQTVLIELRTLAENAIDAASDLRDTFDAGA